MQTVAVLALQDVIAFDMSIPCDLLPRVRLADGSAPYRVLVCAERARVRAGVFDINVPHRLDPLEQADIVIVPGIEDVSVPIPPRVTAALRAAHRRGAVVASICSGAFALAAAGLRDGRLATTHWAAAERLAQRYPLIAVNADVLFVDEGDIITSAGASAGLDMCLHLIRRQHGQAVAAHAARWAVASLHREGGQAQFIRQMPPAGDSLAPLFAWLQEHLHQPIDVASLAGRACMSPRTFARRFREQTGTTPMQWLLTARIRRAQEMLETGAASVDQIARAAGFESPVTFRARFQRVVGLTPTAYRRRFSALRAASRHDR